MILYSIMPSEIVFDLYYNSNASVESASQMLEVSYLGQKILVHPRGDDYVVERILTTSLEAYLDKRLQPGSVIKRAQAHSN